MSSKPALRLESAIFFAIACLVMVLAANFQVIMGDVRNLFGAETESGTGESLRVIGIGVVLAVIAYSGAIVILNPMYAFMVEVVGRVWGGEPKQDSPGNPAENPASKSAGSHKYRRK